jgi:hypothetical protein
MTTCHIACLPPYQPPQARQQTKQFANAYCYTHRPTFHATRLLTQPHQTPGNTSPTAQSQHAKAPDTCIRNRVTFVTAGRSGTRTYCPPLHGEYNRKRANRMNSLHTTAELAHHQLAVCCAACWKPVLAVPAQVHMHWTDGPTLTHTLLAVCAAL